MMNIVDLEDLSAETSLFPTFCSPLRPNPKSNPVRIIWLEIKRLGHMQLFHNTSTQHSLAWKIASQTSPWWEITEVFWENVCL